jgi:guanine deaminase
MTTFIRDASVITMDAEHGSTPWTASLRYDTAIVAIGPDIQPEPGDEIVDGRDMLVAPGFVNAHTHSWESLFKGRFDNMPLELWLLFAYPNRVIEPELVRLRSLLFAAESLKSGVTTIVDDVIETPSQSFDQLDAVVEAYTQAGIRANVSGHIINRPFVDAMPFVGGILDASTAAAVRAEPVVSTEDYLAFSSEAIARYNGAAVDGVRGGRGDGRIRYMVAPSAPQRCPAELIAGATELALAHGIECHIHVLETKTQAVTGPEHYGSTLVEYLASIGGLSPNTTFAHGIWVTNSDIELIAEAGVSVSHNPLSNLKLGSGILPWRRYQDAGVNLGLGTDGASSSDSLRMLDVVKAAALLHKVTHPDLDVWPTVDEVLTAGTIGGARSAVLADVTGSLEVGKQADLVMYDLRTINFTPRNKLDVQLVYSENGSSIRRVVVAGQTVVDDGRLTTIDEAALIAEFDHLRPYLQGWQDDFERANQKFVPAIREMYRRTAERPIGINRWSGDEAAWVS